MTNIYLSPEAESQLKDLLFYLETEWGLGVRDNFLEKLDRALHTIQIFPTGYPESEKFFGLYKCVVTSQTSIFYRIKGDEIEIVALFDNRREI